MPWMRPASIPVGRVWSSFKGRERDGKPALTYQIRDMGEYKQQCLDLMAEHFLRDEPLCQVLGIDKDPVSIATIKDNWEQFVSQEVSLACFVDEDGAPGELVGFNIVVVKGRDDVDDMYKVEGESWKKLLLTLDTAEGLLDVFQHYNVDKYLTSSGLVVLPEHRGQNIAARLIDVRKLLGKALGIEATATVFTATASQVLARKCGYDLLAELPYTEMLDKGVDLTACSTKTAKLMGTKFNFDDVDR